MALQSFHCVVCDKDFAVGKWTCQDGQSNHITAPKQYLLADAPTDAGHPASGGMDSLRDGRTRICNIPPDKTVLRNGEASTIPGGYVEFIRGRFVTTDPETQYYLDKKGGFCTESQWENAWLSQTQQIEIQKMQLAADRQRLENDRNELLARTKEKVGA